MFGTVAVLPDAVVIGVAGSGSHLLMSVDLPAEVAVATVLVGWMAVVVVGDGHGHAVAGHGSVGMLHYQIAIEQVCMARNPNSVSPNSDYKVILYFF